MPQCPNCKKEITQIGTSQVIVLLFKDGKWVPQTCDKYGIFTCWECGEEFTPEDLDKLGVPDDIR